MIISEDDYLLFAEAINDPNATNEDIAAFGQKMKEYETFQKANGLSFTPKLDKLIMQEDERTTMKINSLYSGIDNVPIPDNLKSIFNDSESRARYANESYLKYRYGKDFDNTEYDLYKADFANKNFNSLQPTSETEFYNSIKGSVDAENSAKKRLETNFKKAVESFVSGEQPSVARSRLSKEMPNDFDSNIFDNSYKSLKDVIKDVEPGILKFANAYERKLKGESKPEDETTISDFTTKLNEMPDQKRQLSLIFLRNQAKERGLDALKTRGIFSGLANDFSKSFKRIYKEGLAGRGEAEIESVFSQIPTKGKVNTAVPTINSLEAAKQYVDEQANQKLGAKVSQALASGETVSPFTFETLNPIEGGVERELSLDEELYIKQAIKESRKTISIDREIRNIGSVLDPVADNWSGLMAGTLGSSAAILLPLAISGPAGGAIATEMYRGMEYSSLMSKYPDMDPNTADSVALVSGAVQGALDFAEVGLLKSLGGKLAKKFAPGMTGATVEGAYIGDAILADMGLTYAFENVIEGVQDFTTPIVQEVFSRFDKAVPEVNFDSELKEWASTRPDVAIGMIPLTIFGGAMSAGSKLYSDSRLLKEASDIERLTDAGIVESDRMTLSKMVEDRNIEGIRSFLPTAWERRDMNIVKQRVAEKLNQKLLSVNAAATLNAAIQAGAIPNFSVNENGQYLVEGVDKPFNTREEVMGYITSRIDEINSAKSSIIVEGVRDPEKTATDLNISSDPVQLDSENDSLSELNGLNKSKVNELNNSFGDKVQQDRVFKQIVGNILSGKKTAETALQEYIDGVYNNLPTSTKNALGVDETSGKQALFDLVTMNKNKIQSANKRSLGNYSTTIYDSINQLTKFNSFVVFSPDKTGLEEWQDFVEYAKKYNNFIQGNPTPQDIQKFENDNLELSKKFPYDKSVFNAVSLMNDFQLLTLNNIQNQLDEAYALDLQKPQDQRRFSNRPIVQPVFASALDPNDPNFAKSKESILWLERFKEIFGVNVMLYTNSENVPGGVAGVYDAYSDTVFVSINDYDAIPYTIGHEYLHRIRAQQPEIYKQIVSVINSTVTKEQRDQYYNVIPYTYFMDDKVYKKNVTEIISLNEKISQTTDSKKITKLQNKIKVLSNENYNIVEQAKKDKETYIKTPENEREKFYVGKKFFGLGVKYSKNTKVFDRFPTEKEFSDGIQEEFIAEMFGSNFTNNNFWNEFIKLKNTSQFKETINSIIDYNKKLISKTVNFDIATQNFAIADINAQLGSELKTIQDGLVKVLDNPKLLQRTLTPFKNLTVKEFELKYQSASFNRYSIQQLNNIQSIINNSTVLIPATSKMSDAQKDVLESDERQIEQMQNLPPGSVKFIGGILTHKPGSSKNVIENVGLFNDFISEFSKEYKVNVLFFEQQGGQDFYAGFYNPSTRTIFINRKTPKPYLVLYGHEFGHSLETTDPALYKSLTKGLFDITTQYNRNFLLDALNKVPDFYFKLNNGRTNADNKAEYIKHIENANKVVKDKIYLNKIQIIDLEASSNAEIANDLIGLLFTDKKLFQELRKKDANLFMKVVLAIWDYTDNLLNFISNNVLKKPDLDGKQIIEEYYKGKNVNLNLSVASYEAMRSLLADTLYQYKINIDNLGINRTLAGIGNAKKGTPTNISASLFKPSTVTTTPNNEVQHVVNKIRNTVSSAKVIAEKARKRGAKAANEVIVEETISEIVSPINEESFNAAAKNRSLNKNEMDSDEFLKKAKILKNSLRKALSNNDTSLNALSNAAAVINGSYSDISNLFKSEKLKYISNAIDNLNEQLKDVYLEEINVTKQTFSNLENDYRNKGKNEIADMFKMYVEAFESTDPSGDASLLFNELYTPNGVPVATNVKEYNDKLLKYNVLKTVGNYAELNADQLENLLTTLDSFIANVDTTNFSKQLQDLVDSMKYISETSPTLEKRELEQFNKMNNLRQPVWSGIKKIFQPLTDMISSFTDSHLTFASLIELVYPNNVEANKKTYARIAELTSILEDSNATEEDKADASTELNILRDSIGKAIVPEMQKVVDDLRNAYTDILIDNEENEENLRKVIAKAFNLKSSASKYVNKKLYELVDRKSGFTVKINNRDYVLSQAYAGYILNIAETDSHGEALTNAGFTIDVLTEIRNGISNEANEIRLELRKLIRKEHQKANEASLKKMGFGTLIPDETYFPVQYKSTSTAIIDSFDINFQGGITDKDNENVLKSEGRDIELDLNVQAINMLSMFNSHMYLSTHKRNVTAPITVAKAVLLDKDISDRITAAFGNDFYGQLFKLLGAIETNGVRTVEMSRTWRNYMRGLMTGAAKGALAMNPTTIILNATSVFNTGLDSSIPFNRAISSYGRVLLATLTGNQLGTIPKTAKEIRQFNIIKQRIKNGANSLLAMSKSDPTVSKPTALSNAGDFGMRPISFSDGFFGSFAAAAAYDAHYRMAEESGLSKSEAEAAAEEGMKRTIQTTFQPNTVANKATVEVGSNIVMRMLGMFMSEARKAVGLEITAFKKNGLFSKEFGRFIIVNHFIIGGLSYLIRSSIKDALKGEDEDEDIWNPAQLAQNILVGPLAGLFIVGTALESSAIWLTNNLIDGLDVKNERVKADLGIIEMRGKVKKLPVFPKDNIISSTAKQLQDVKNIFEAETFTEGVDAAINAGKGLGAILNNNSISGATTIAKTLKVIADAIDENGGDFMEEPKK